MSEIKVERIWANVGAHYPEPPRRGRPSGYKGPPEGYKDYRREQSKLWARKKREASSNGEVK